MGKVIDGCTRVIVTSLVGKSEVKVPDISVCQKNTFVRGYRSKRRFVCEISGNFFVTYIFYFIYPNFLFSSSASFFYCRKDQSYHIFSIQCEGNLLSNSTGPTDNSCDDRYFRFRDFVFFKSRKETRIF